MLAAVILAAGESRRMGFPKALLPYHGRTFLEHLLAVTEHPGIGARVVIVGAAATEISRRVPLSPGLLVENQEWQKGQISSIRAGLRALRPTETEGILLALVDHPLVTPAVVDALLAAFERSPGAIVLPTWHRRRGHPVIFPSRLYAELERSPDDIGARAVVWAHSQDVVEVPTAEEGVVLDIDDRATFERLFPSTPAP